jgi:hypothetical protein
MRKVGNAAVSGALSDPLELGVERLESKIAGTFLQ